MTKIEDLRAQLVNRIRQSREQRLEAARSMMDCQHTWKPYRETITPDNPAFHGSAYLRLIGCPKCKRKQYLDLNISA